MGKEMFPQLDIRIKAEGLGGGTGMLGLIKLPY